MAPITLLCIAAVVSAAAAGTPLKYMLRDKIVSHQRANGLLRHAESGIPPDMFYTQTLDHFDVTDSRTWQQRYWVNDTFYKPGGNVFLYVEGEGTGKWSSAELPQLLPASPSSAYSFPSQRRFPLRCVGG